MGLQERLEADLKQAIREGDSVRKNTIRLALTEIKLASVSHGRSLSDEETIQILRKQVQIRRETVEEAGRAGRPDLVEEAEAEIDVLEKYLPPPFSEDELERLVKEAIAQVDAKSISDVGKVMKVLIPMLEGKVPGGEAHQVVRRVLADDG